MNLDYVSLCQLYYAKVMLYFHLYSSLVSTMSRIQRPLSQQFPPSDPELKHKPVARELLVRRSTRHEPLPEKRLPTQQNMELYDRNRTAPSGVERVPGSEKNGDLPVDQLIPLEELPRSETQSPALVDDVPLLRRPKRQNKIVPSFNYNTDISICCGIILIIIGICEIVLNITAIVRHHLTGQQHVLNLVFYLAPGIWCAVFVSITYKLCQDKSKTYIYIYIYIYSE